MDLKITYFLLNWCFAQYEVPPKRGSEKDYVFYPAVFWKMAALKISQNSKGNTREGVLLKLQACNLQLYLKQCLYRKRFTKNFEIFFRKGIL